MLEQISNSASDCLSAISDYLPAMSHLSPVTMVGIGVVAIGTLLYLLTRMPELLLVIGTALIYAAVPLIPKLM